MSVILFLFLSFVRLLYLSSNKMKNEQYYTVGTVLKSKKNIVEILIDWCLTPTSAVFQLYRGVEIGNIDTLNTQIHDSSISCLGTVTTIKRGGVKLVLWTQTLFLNVYYFFMIRKIHNI